MANEKHVKALPDEEQKKAAAARQAEDVKTARLRALRLAKEAADKDAAAEEAAAKVPPRRRAKAPRSRTSLEASTTVDGFC